MQNTFARARSTANPSPCDDRISRIFVWIIIFEIFVGQNTPPIVETFGKICRPFRQKVLTMAQLYKNSKLDKK